MRPIHRLALVLLFAGSSAPAFAQQAPPRPPRQDARQADARRPARERPTPEQRVDRHVQHLDQQLALSDAQEAQIRRIFADKAAQHQRQVQQRREARPDTRPQTRPEGRRAEGARPARPQLTPEQRDAMRSRMRAEMEQTQRQILAVLTPEQAERYQRLEAERRAKAQQRHQERPDRRGARTPGRGRTPR